MTITDIHTHAFPDGLAPRAIEALNANIVPDRHAVLDGTIGGLLDSMDAAGIDRSVICSIATAPKQVDAILRWSLSVRSERIVPFGSVHPDCADPAGEVEKIAAAGLLGVKLHPMYQDFETDDQRRWPVYGALQETGLVLVLHSGCDVAFPPDDDRAVPRRLLAVHEAFPDLRIIAAHMGAWRMWDGVIDTLAGTGVYLDTSYTFGEARPDVIEHLLARHPVERILFGTDSPWREQGRTLELVRQAFPDPEEQRMVLGGNAQRLVDSC